MKASMYTFSVPVFVKTLGNLSALNDPAVKQNLDTFGSEAGGQKPAEFAAFVLQEKEKWGAIVRDANVKP